MDQDTFDQYEMDRGRDRDDEEAYVLLSENALRNYDLCDEDADWDEADW